MTQLEKFKNVIENGFREFAYVLSEPDPKKDNNEICGECGQIPEDCICNTDPLPMLTLLNGDN